MNSTHKLEKILNRIGVSLNGPHPWDIQIHDIRCLDRILREGSLGAGETYMEGLWDCDQLDELFFRIFRNRLDNQSAPFWKIAILKLTNMLINQQKREKVKKIIHPYWSLDNSFYETMLGKSMAYSCGYWQKANNLDEAQFAKYDLICKKLYLKPQDKVLDLGCGWGGLVKFMAENYSVEITAIDANQQSIEYAKEKCRNLNIRFYLGDYRDYKYYNPNNMKFDKAVSVGVMEHVGYKNYTHFLKLVQSQINPESIFLLHTIGSNISVNYTDPWIDKYIFPHGHLPSLKQLGQAFENLFVVEDLQNFGVYYDPTLMAWHQNLNQHWPELKEKYGEKFRRMMNYYLLSCAAGFRAREMQLWQFVLTPRGLVEGYFRPT